MAAITIKRLQELINETHQHGLKLDAEIREAEAKHETAKYEALRKELDALELLNKQRRKEIEEKEPKPKPPPAPPKPAPRIYMFDAVTLSAIPRDPEAVAAYIDGYYNFPEAVTWFPRAKHVSIATHPWHDADAMDIEPGACRPGDAPAWVRRQHARGVKRPIVYAPEGEIYEAIQALTDNGIKRDEYLLWVAHWVNYPHIDSGFDAMQYEDHGEFDASLCEPYFFDGI